MPKRSRQLKSVGEPFDDSDLEPVSLHLRPIDFSVYSPSHLPMPEEGCTGERPPIFPTIDGTGSAEANNNVLLAIQGRISEYHL